MNPSKLIDGRRESKILQHNPHSIKTIQRIYDILSYYSTIPDSIKHKQMHYQQPNGIPIFLKGGPMDRVLFGTTVGFCALGFANLAYFAYTMAIPAKNK